MIVNKIGLFVLNIKLIITTLYTWKYKSQLLIALLLITIYYVIPKGKNKNKMLYSRTLLLYLRRKKKQFCKHISYTDPYNDKGQYHKTKRALKIVFSSFVT